MSAPLVAADLDRTLIYSASALALPREDGPVRRLLCVELYEGRPLSFLTEAAARHLAALTAAGVLMPVTTRTVEQFRRITLPGPPVKLALCANGGRLLRDGAEDPDFTAMVTEMLAGSAAPAAEMLAELHRVAAPVAGPPFVTKVRDASGLFCYAVVERELTPDDWIAQLSAFAGERGWSLSIQGRKVYLVPLALSKGTAARSVAGMLGTTTLLAAGDSLLDRSLLELADSGIRPAHGELHETGWSAPHVSVTTSRGVLAGEEIARWLHEWATP